MSVQQLSDAVERLGVTIQRPVLSNFENGRRDTIAAAEVHAIAAALRVPPVLLEYPIGRVELIEVLPDVEVPPWQAAQWAMGNGDLPSAPRSEEVEVIRLFQLHQEYRNAAIEAQLAERAVRQAADITSTDDQEAMSRLEEDHRARARRAEFWLWDLRGRIKRAGLIPPHLPPELAHIDVNFHPPQIIDPPLGVAE